MEVGAREIDLDFARLDLDRLKRCGRGEVVYGAGKTAQELCQICLSLREADQPVLATRVPAEHIVELVRQVPDAVPHERARCVTIGQHAERSGSEVGVLCAGTSDLGVASEAAVTLKFFGWKVRTIADIGVAGLHRLLSRLEEIRACDVLIVVAGMEGALPSVVGGLVDRPVIAVPTSVGYGAGAAGVAALLGMLTSCSSGVTVVNIDNGFGAACAADAILRLVQA